MTEDAAVLYTDVVDSTLLNARWGDEVMARVWAQHDRAARDLIHAWRGQEVGRGDGFLVVFSNVADAVGFAVAYHRSLAEISPPLSARIGLHVGPVSLRENSSFDTERGATRFEMDGIALPIATRIMSTAIGGQTLLSAAAVAALGATDLRTRSHGHWRLKGVADPIELIEIGDDASPFTPPPESAKAYRVVQHGSDWQPLRDVPNNLPAERDSFIGRRSALQGLANAFDGGARLVTLLGIGGIGKTRLALHYARTWLGDYPGGAWFCDLSPTRRLDGVINAVAQGLNVPLGGAEPIEKLGAAIAGRGRCLVILDNFEQVARHAEQTLGAWLERAPETRFIVTSREVLGIAGEQALVLAPLDQTDAVEMFKERVRAVGARGDSGPEDEAAIAPLVDLLDRLPLAIELASARARVMSPRAMLQRMGERFKLLATRGGRTDRQATLRAALDWSWNLLSPAEQSALAQLSVFEGGLSLDAAEAVVELSGVDPSADVLSIVQALVEKSLVLKASDERFNLLGTVQQYADEQLRAVVADATGALTEAQRRHSEYFARLGKHGQGIRDDVINMAVAARRAAAAGWIDSAVGALEGAWSGLRLRGPFRAALDLADVVGAIPGLDDVSRARVDRVAGVALKECGRIAEAETRLTSSLDAVRRAGDPIKAEGDILVYLGDLHVSAGRMQEGESELSSALAISKALQDRVLECRAHSSLGNLHRSMGELDAARRAYDAALAAARAAGDRRWEGGTLGNLGVVCFDQGKLAEARAFYTEALNAARELGDRNWEGNALCNLGLLRHVQGQSELAITQLEDALVIARELGSVRLECVVLCNLGIVNETLQASEAARTHYEEALGVARALSDRRSEGQVLGYLGVLHARQGRFGDSRRCLDEGEELLVEVEDQINLALLHCGRAESEFLAGAGTEARAALIRAQDLARALGAGAGSELGDSIERVRKLMITEPTALTVATVS
jgi:predicted ATPase/class 3 adenylate cyclase